MYHPKGEEVLEKHAQVTKFDTFDEDKIIAFLNENKIDGIMLRAPAKITPAILDACDEVKAISGAGVGLDNIDVDYATKKRSEEHTSELQSRGQLVCRLLLEKKKLQIRHKV